MTSTGRAALFYGPGRPFALTELPVPDPERVADTMVAGVNCALAQVVMGLERVQVGLGDRVVVQGAGGLGVYATAVARDRGAAQIVVIDGIEDRLALARRMGADETVDLRELASPDERIARVRELADQDAGRVTRASIVMT